MDIKMRFWFKSYENNLTMSASVVIFEDSLNM